MGDENENPIATPEEPKKAKKKSPFADMKAIGVGGEAEASVTPGLPLRELTPEEQAELTASIFGVKPPSPAVAEAASEGTALARTEGETDDSPDALDIALEELPELTKLIQEGGVTIQRGLVKGLKLITKALEVLAEGDDDDDEDDPDEEAVDGDEPQESVLSLEDAVGFVHVFSGVGTLLELLYGSDERKKAFLEFTAKLAPQEQALLSQTLSVLHMMLEKMPRRIAELADASETELAQAGLEFLEKVKASAQATLDREAKRKGG